MNQEPAQNTNSKIVRTTVIVAILFAATFVTSTLLKKEREALLGNSTNINGRPFSQPYIDATGQLTDPGGAYKVTVPDGWYPHTSPDGAIIFTKSPELTIPEGTEWYAIGSQFVIRKGTLDEIKGSKTAEDWMKGSYLAPGFEGFKSRKTVTNKLGVQFERIIREATLAGGDELSYVNFSNDGTLIVLWHYPYIEGSSDSDAFESLVGSFFRVLGNENQPQPPATSGGGESGDGISDQPIPAAIKARENLAQTLGISDLTSISIDETTKTNWPDACLGISEEGIMCAQVIVPGYKIHLRVGGVGYTYRTNLGGSVIKQVSEGRL